LDFSAILVTQFRSGCMKVKLLFLVFLLYASTAFCQTGMEQHYKIYSTAQKKLVDADAIIADMANADVLFFGEEHNDSTGHYLEHVLFEKLCKKYPTTAALSMEMFETDCQIPLNEYLNGIIREKNLTTDARAWHNYKDYRPMMEYAKQWHIPVVAANAPQRYAHLVSTDGLAGLKQLDRAALTYLSPIPIDTATGAYYEKFVNIMGGHGAMGGMKIYQAQNLWDATMGWSIAKFYNSHKKYKIMQVNGGFHSEEKLGAAAQLKKYAPKVRILNIAAYADDSFDNPDWTKWSSKGDYIILTDPKLPKTF